MYNWFSKSCNKVTCYDTEDQDYPEPISRATNGYEYVDLGLSVCWATHNVGARSIEDYGDYYSWGESRAKDYWDWLNYAYCQGTQETMTKYCLQSEYGKVDNLAKLEFSDDAANVNWGGGWRMPRESEMMELINKCNWEAAVVNNTKGYYVTGPSKHKIFLPLAGRGRHGSNPVGQGEYGFYWTSTLSKTYSCSGRIIHFNEKPAETTDDWVRYIGLPVRPVIKNPLEQTDQNNSGGNDDNGGSSSGGNGGGTPTGYPPEFVHFTSTSTKNSITIEFYTDVRAERATVKYGTSISPSRSTSSTITNKQIRARVTGLKSGTKYYFSCTASNQYGSTTSETVPVMTEYD